MKNNKKQKVSSERLLIHITDTLSFFLVGAGKPQGWVLTYVAIHVFAEIDVCRAEVAVQPHLPVALRCFGSDSQRHQVVPGDSIQFSFTCGIS